MSKEIFFNSKSKEYWELSNFYGGVESNYMVTRFDDNEVHRMFSNFETCDKERFEDYLKQLQPDKKDWTDRKLKYWTRDGEPIRGILSQLVGSSVRDTASGKKRRKVIKEMVGIGELRIKPNTTDDEKKKLMMTLLRDKFKNETYRDVLISTGDALLHEKPLRGKPNSWTFKNREGGDWLGTLLMEVRKEIKEEGCR